MRVLLTGGCGFIGSNFVRQRLTEAGSPNFVRHVLAQREDLELVNLDALTYAGNPANLADLADHPRYRFIKGDVADRVAAAEAVRGWLRNASPALFD